MEKTTNFLRLLSALFSATAAGLLLAQRIKQSVREAEQELAEEDALAGLKDAVGRAAAGKAGA